MNGKSIVGTAAAALLTVGTLAGCGASPETSDFDMNTPATLVSDAFHPQEGVANPGQYSETAIFSDVTVRQCKTAGEATRCVVRVIQVSDNTFRQVDKLIGQQIMPSSLLRQNP